MGTGTKGFWACFGGIFGVIAALIVALAYVVLGTFFTVTVGGCRILGSDREKPKPRRETPVTASPAPSTAATPVPASPDEQPTSTPTATRPSDGGQAFKIVSFDYRVIERNNVFWRIAWKCTVRNTSAEAMTLWATVQFLDKDEFEVDTDDAQVGRLAPGQEREVSDAALVSVGNAQQIASARVVVKKTPW